MDKSAQRDVEPGKELNANSTLIMEGNQLQLMETDKQQAVNADHNGVLIEAQRSIVPKQAGALSLDAVGTINDENSIGTNGLESMVEDSEGLIASMRQNYREVESGNPTRNFQNVEDQESEEEELVVKDTESDNEQLAIFGPTSFGGENKLRASQIEGINLHVELKPKEARKLIRCQTFEECMNSQDSIHVGFRDKPASQRQNLILQELLNTKDTGNTIGSGI